MSFYRTINATGFDDLSEFSLPPNNPNFRPVIKIDKLPRVKLSKSFAYLGKKEKKEPFSELHKYLTDMPTHWFTRLPQLILYPTEFRGDCCSGVVVELYKYAAIIFIGNSLGEVAVAYRRIVGKIFNDLHVGVTVSFVRCKTRNRVPRYVEHGVAVISCLSYPKFIELNAENCVVFQGHFQFYNLWIEDNYILVSTEQYGKVYVRHGTPLWKFIKEKDFDRTTTIYSRIRFNFQYRSGHTSFFEFDDCFTVLNNTAIVENEGVGIPLMTDFL